MEEKQGSQVTPSVTPTRVEENRRASMCAFLDAYARLGVIGRAAEEAGIDRRTVYRWKEEDAEFAELFESAKEAYVEALEEEADRRGRIGWKEPVGWYRGKAGGKVRRHSDALLMFRLKALAPDKYRERVHVSGMFGRIDFSQLPDEVVARIAAGEHPEAVFASYRGELPQLPASTTNTGPGDQ